MHNSHLFLSDMSMQALVSPPPLTHPERSQWPHRGKRNPSQGYVSTHAQQKALSYTQPGRGRR